MSHGTTLIYVSVLDTVPSGRLIASVRVTGVGAELRVVEECPGLEDVVIATLALPDTGGVWAPVKATTVSPRAGTNTYRLEGRCQAALASVRGASLTLLRVG